MIRNEYISLLERSCENHSSNKTIKTITTEALKSFNNLNPTSKNQMFEAKTISYDLRNSNVLFQLKCQKVTYGNHTLKMYESQIRNLLPNETKLYTVFDKFKSLLKSWEGPKCQCTMCNALS